MNDQLYDDVAIERQIATLFGIETDIDAVIARRIPVNRNAEATLFLTKKKQLYLFVHGESKLLLADVQKIVSHIGLVAETYVPPKGRPNYFNEVGTRKFQEVFPGRKAVNDQDIAFYRTLTSYSPALVLIREVKTGTIYQHDADARGGWRPHAKFSYRRIKTSV